MTDHSAGPPAAAPGTPAPAFARALTEIWHKTECWGAVACFAFIAILLLVDVVGREILAPLLRASGMTVGALGVQGSQKLSVFALVIGSFLGIGIATATASHLTPRVAFGWVPKSWDAGMNRLADVIAFVALSYVAWVAWTFVMSTKTAGLVVPMLGVKVWPIQLALPIGFASAAGRYLLYAIWPALRPLPPEFQE
ncbi:MAG: TRAP transporter small permease subunit [Burkholderiales bacterium]|nr:TRAP transporter small permease subunit [Burkholderiales bacterium]